MEQPHGEKYALSAVQSFRFAQLDTRYLCGRPVVLLS